MFGILLSLFIQCYVWNTTNPYPVIISKFYRQHLNLCTLCLETDKIKFSMIACFESIQQLSQSIFILTIVPDLRGVSITQTFHSVHYWNFQMEIWQNSYLSQKNNCYNN